MADGEITFTYAGQHVTVTSSGHISCEDRRPEAAVGDHSEFAEL